MNKLLKASDLRLLECRRDVEKAHARNNVLTDSLTSQSVLVSRMTNNLLALQLQIVHEKSHSSYDFPQSAHVVVTTNDDTKFDINDVDFSINARMALIHGIVYDRTKHCSGWLGSITSFLRVWTHIKNIVRPDRHLCCYPQCPHQHTTRKYSDLLCQTCTLATSVVCVYHNDCFKCHKWNVTMLECPGKSIYDATTCALIKTGAHIEIINASLYPLRQQLYVRKIVSKTMDVVVKRSRNEGQDDQENASKRINVQAEIPICDEADYL